MPAPQIAITVNVAGLEERMQAIAEEAHLSMVMAADYMAEAKAAMMAAEVQSENAHQSAMAAEVQSENALQSAKAAFWVVNPKAKAPPIPLAFKAKAALAIGAKTKALLVQVPKVGGHHQQRPKPKPPPNNVGGHHNKAKAPGIVGKGKAPNIVGGHHNKAKAPGDAGLAKAMAKAVLMAAM